MDGATKWNEVRYAYSGVIFHKATFSEIKKKPPCTDVVSYVFFVMFEFLFRQKCGGKYLSLPSFLLYFPYFFCKIKQKNLNNDYFLIFSFFALFLSFF